MSKLIFLDTETSGLGVTDRLIQLGCIIVLDSNLESMKDAVTIDLLYKIDFNIQLGAQKVHNISNLMIKDKLYFVNSKLYQLLTELNNKLNIIIAHNAPFDIKMVLKLNITINCQIIDTLQVARTCYKGAPSHKLQSLRQMLSLENHLKPLLLSLNMDMDIIAHSALSDVIVMVNLFREMIKTTPIHEMVKISNYYNGGVNMPFGKYRGVLISLIKDKNYLMWCKTNINNLSPLILLLINKVLGVK